MADDRFAPPNGGGLSRSECDSSPQHKPYSQQAITDIVRVMEGLGFDDSD